LTADFHSVRFGAGSFKLSVLSYSSQSLFGFVHVTPISSVLSQGRFAGGYRLKRANNLNEFALTIPNEDGGLIIDEIGWREPLIFARAFGSQYWDVINTAHAQHIASVTCSENQIRFLNLFK
jgi:hypothetical protein